MNNEDKRRHIFNGLKKIEGDMEAINKLQIELSKELDSCNDFFIAGSFASIMANIAGTLYCLEQSICNDCLDKGVVNNDK